MDAEPDSFAPPLATRLLILQPTPFCNIRCRYCYLPDRDDRSRMSVATVRRVAERLLEAGLVQQELVVVWHAGEPLAVPPAFYEQAFATLAEVLGAHTRLTHCIQTNAMLIDDAWCALFEAHGVKVGVSLDGPAALHDRHRVGRRGGGTHAQVMRGVARLQRRGIPFHVIAVVTADTLPQAEAFANFFAELAPSELGLNFDEAEGEHPASSLEGREAAHADFLRALLPWVRSGRLHVRELAQAHTLVTRPLPRYRWAGVEWPDNAQVLPYALLNVAHDGAFGTFSPELLGQPSAAHGNFLLGNVHDTPLRDALRTPAFAKLWREIRDGVARCRDRCAHFAWCGGGSPVNKLYETGSMAADETLYCRSMVKRPFELVLAELERQLQK
ncbi:MAG: GRRM system radical SAM/SPASM domain protein [Rubrivivax sp.]|nr:GRRM system radical SAM/SPASM domain protein [Rubrivivax sp.]